MTELSVLAGGALFICGLLALRALMRAVKRRHEAGEPRIPRAMRVAVALLALAAVIGGPVVMVKTLLRQAHKNEYLIEELRKNGTAAVATILELDETGTVYNERPEMNVLLNVKPKGAPSFLATATWAFSVKDVQNYRVDAQVEVLFDPKDPQRVAVIGMSRLAQE